MEEINLIERLKQGKSIKRFLQSGLNLNCQDENGQTPLMIAAEKGYLEEVEGLLEFAADPNIQDNKGISALMIASDKGRSKIVRALVKWGADRTLVDREGNAAEIYALVGSYVEEERRKSQSRISSSFQKS